MEIIETVDDDVVRLRSWFKSDGIVLMMEIKKFDIWWERKHKNPTAGAVYWS